MTLGLFLDPERQNPSETRRLGWQTPEPSQRVGKWRRSQSIRTAARLPLVFSVLEAQPAFTYQRLALDAVRLTGLGLSATAVARILGVSDKTITKAVRRGRDESKRHGV